MAKTFKLTLALVMLVLLAWLAMPVAAQSPSPNDIRLTVAAIRVQVAGDTAEAKALEVQAREIERQQANATAQQRNADATQAALIKPTLLAMELPTVTPMPSVTPALILAPSATIATITTQAVIAKQNQIAIYLENISAPAIATGLLLVIAIVMITVAEILDRKRKAEKAK